MSPSAEIVDYSSIITFDSATQPGVSFTIAKVSLARRLELTRTIRSLLRELEYEAAGKSVTARLSAAEMALAIERAYIAWGLIRVDGLLIDGVEATPKSIVEFAPEPLCREIATAIRKQCYLSDAERKN